MTGLLTDYYKNLAEQEWRLNVERKISDLEEYVFKTARKSVTTKAQQILLLYELGFLEKIQRFDIKQKNKTKLLAILLNSSEDNVKKDLADIIKQYPKMKNSINYKFLLETFNSVGLKDNAKKVENELNEIFKREEKKKNKK